MYLFPLRSRTRPQFEEEKKLFIGQKEIENILLNHVKTYFKTKSSLWEVWFIDFTPSC